MATDLTGTKIKDTYQQILHVDGGVTSTDKIVYDGDGTATGLKVSTTGIDATVLKLAGSAVTASATELNLLDGATGTLVNTATAQTLTNKTISADNNTLSGIAASSFVLSNASGNIDGAVAQKAIPAGVVVGTTDTQTLTNKTLTAPVVNTPNLTGGTINNATIGASTASTVASTNLSYTGTLTGGTGVVNLGSGQIYKDASGNVGIGTSSPTKKLHVVGDVLATPSTWGTSGTGVVYLGDINNYVSSTFGGATTVAGFETVTFGTTNGGYSEKMRINTAGNVGIGTSSPAVRLQVNSSELIISNFIGNNANNYIQLSDNNGTNFCSVGSISGGNFYTYTVGYSAFYTGGSEKMRLDSSGNVGIGTSSPTFKLDVNGDARLSNSRFTTNALEIAPYASGDRASLIDFHSSGLPDAIDYSARIIRVGGVNGAFSITNTGLGSIVFETNSTERMRIDSSGNVGIGTSSSSSLLSLGNGFSDVKLAVFDGGSAAANYGFGIGSGALRYTAGAAGAHVFYTSNTERMRIDDSGNFLVGTSSAQGKISALSTNASLPVARLYLNAASSTGTPALFLDKLDNNSTTSQVFVQFSINSQSTGSGQINANGSAQAAFGTFSDARLKQNIVDLPSQLNNICALRPVEFDYIESEGGGHQTGFIAQEMQEVYPDVVCERADGMLTVTGWSKTEARLVKAIQELSAKVDTLQAEINTLKGN